MQLDNEVAVKYQAQMIPSSLLAPQYWDVATFLHKGDTTQYIWLKIGLGGEGRAEPVCM
jgi:hypothetical protein